VLKDDAKYISDQMGHKDIRFTSGVYMKATIRRSKLFGAYLAEFDRTLEWAALPTTVAEVLAAIGSRDQIAGQTIERELSNLA
jgi:hypothetical protein